jgi:hypothetical protein
MSLDGNYNGCGRVTIDQARSDATTEFQSSGLTDNHLSAHKRQHAQGNRPAVRSADKA